MVQHMNIDLKLADFVIDATQPYMSGALLPAVVFLVCGVYAYATGSFWDLAAVITPIVIPLALAMDVNPIIAGAAVFSGAALGSTTCLYGDGIILASRSTGIKPLNLMTAILPTRPSRRPCRSCCTSSSASPGPDRTRPTRPIVPSAGGALAKSSVAARIPGSAA